MDIVDLLLWVVYILLGTVTILAVWSAVHGLRCRQKTVEPTPGVPGRTIAWGTAALLVVSLVVTFLLGSSEPMLINGQWLKDAFWLKLCDMFIYTALLLLLVASAGVVVGSSGLMRRKDGRRMPAGRASAANEGRTA